MRTSFGLFLLVGLFATACGPSGSKSGTQTDGCAAYATNYCNRLATCSPFLIQVQFGDVASCVARMQPLCGARMQAQGSGLGAAQVQACADAYPSAACEKVILVGWQPDACAVKGTLADGAACGHGAQCVSGYCRTPFTQVCGACTPLVPLGGGCSRIEDCAAPYACLNSGTCGALTPRGGGCRTTPCELDLECINLVCDSSPGAGAACENGIYDCTDRLGLYCEPTTMRCTAETVVPTGGSCATGAVICGSSGSCNPDTQICDAPVDDGAACDSTGRCRYPAVCVAGVCKAPDPTTCH
jgi:hypothetical protein